MPATGHGHVTPRADGMKARCGGPGLCAQCSQEAATAAFRESAGAPTPEPSRALEKESD